MVVASRRHRHRRRRLCGLAFHLLTPSSPLHAVLLRTAPSPVRGAISVSVSQAHVTYYWDAAALIALFIPHLHIISKGTCALISLFFFSF